MKSRTASWGKRQARRHKQDTINILRLTNTGSDLYMSNISQMRSNVVTIDKLPETKARCILVVDDHEPNRDMLCRRLQRQGYQTLFACHGKQALEMLRQEDIDLVLLDVMMPVMDGYATLQSIKSDRALCHIPVIMITALNETDSAVKCINLGAEDYIAKPFNPVILNARVNASLNKKRLHDYEHQMHAAVERQNELLEKCVRDQVREISSAQLAAIFAMSKLAESKDPETGEHLDRMREYCKLLSVCLAKLPKYKGVIDQTFIDNIYAASPLHDIGKVGVPDNILLKPGKLTEDEWVVMKTHALIGGDTLRAVDRLYPGNGLIRTGIDIAENHHEKWNGRGYPRGLKGEQIPLVARILALGDVYDALTSRRCYKEAFSHEKSREILIKDSGIHFDPDVVGAFLAIEEEFIHVRKFYQDKEEQ